MSDVLDTQIKKRDNNGFQKDLEQKVEERTKELEKIRNALTNILEDTEEARKRVEEEKNKTTAIIANFFDPVIVTNNTWQIILFNPAAKRRFKLSNKDLGKKVRVVNNNFSFNSFKSIIKVKHKSKIIEKDENGCPIIEEVSIGALNQDKNIEKTDVLFYKVLTSKVKDENNVCLGYMKIFYDLTREKAIERLKNEFVSISAHQLRTPLSAIKWSLKMVLDGEMGKINDEVKEYLNKTYRTNEVMIRLVNELLDVSHIEEGRFLCDLKLISIEEIINQVIFSSSVLARKKKIRIIFNKSKDVLPKIKVDLKKMKLAIQNVVDNAIKYSKANSKVVINLKKISQGRKEFIKIDIEDSGLGIEKKDQKRIFSKFFRSENAVRYQAEGTGLGLFIVRNIINAHKGKVWFESEKNEGTIFYIQLPINLSNH